MDLPAFLSLQKQLIRFKEHKGKIMMKHNEVWKQRGASNVALTYGHMGNPCFLYEIYLKDNSNQLNVK